MSRKKYIRLENLTPNGKPWQELREESVKERATPSIQIKGLTKGQERFINALDTSILTIVTGPAGTGKTFISCATALKKLFENKIKRIILTRPTVDCGGSIGFLPGEIEQKLRPYLLPLFDAMEEFIGEKELDRLIQSDIIRLSPLTFMRGSSFKDSFIILDEAQNCELFEQRMFLSRFGRNCQCVMLGDLTQSDVFEGLTDYEIAIKKLQPLKDEVSFIKLTEKDIVRHDLTSKIIRCLQ